MISSTTPSNYYATSGECLSGALQWQELVQITTGVGFAPPVLVKSIIFECDSPKVTEFLGKLQNLQCVNTDMASLFVRPWDNILGDIHRVSRGFHARVLFRYLPANQTRKTGWGSRKARLHCWSSIQGYKITWMIVCFFVIQQLQKYNNLWRCNKFTLLGKCYFKPSRWLCSCYRNYQRIREWSAVFFPRYP